MPSLGADMAAGVLAAWRVAVGDRVSQGDIIAEVETDKGLIEVEVFETGVVERLLVREGEKVPVGTVLAEIDTAAAAQCQRRCQRRCQRQCQRQCRGRSSPLVLPKSTSMDRWPLRPSGGVHMS